MLNGTLEHDSEIVVPAGVPELHVLVRPPRNALLHHRNCDFGAVIDVIELQCV